MVSINGNFGFFERNNSLKTQNTNLEKAGNVPISKPDEAKETANVENKDFEFGIGSKHQAGQIKGLEVEGMSKIAKEDAVQLAQMYEMAGIKAPLPTKQVYSRVAASVNQFSSTLDEVETEGHAQDLFNSQSFAKLNNIFGIS